METMHARLTHQNRAQIIKQQYNVSVCLHLGMNTRTVVLFDPCNRGPIRFGCGFKTTRLQEEEHRFVKKASVCYT